MLMTECLLTFKGETPGRRLEMPDKLVSSHVLSFTDCNLHAKS